MDGYKLVRGFQWTERREEDQKERRKEGSCSFNSMDRSAQNIDRSSDSELMNLRRMMKFVFDVAPLEIIDNNNNKELLLLFDEEDEDFFHAGVGVGVGVGGAAAAVGVGMNINQINLVIHVINHDLIFQYWSLKSEQQQQLNSSCHGNKHHRNHHRDHHHLREDDDDEEMIMIACQPLLTPKTENIVLDRGGSVYASTADDDYLMSLLRDMDILYEIEWIFKPEQLKEVKRCIIQRINESKPAVALLAKPPKTVRIRLDVAYITKKYYANPAAAASAYAQKTFNNLEAAAAFAIDYPAAPPTFYDDDDKPSRTPLTTALRSSIEALKTKILDEEDLISSSSSSSCSVCLVEFCVGVDEIKKMPCSHVFHCNCLMNWLWERNTCPLCFYPLPTFASRFLEDQLP